MLIYSKLQEEVKRRATKNQDGGEYTNAVKTAINSSLFRISREARWRSMRRKTTFSTRGTYSVGSGVGAYTLDSTLITVPTASFLTAGIKIGQRINLSGDRNYHIIETIPTESTITIKEAYSGTTTLLGTYEIMGQEEYNLPIQAGHSMFLWYENGGSPQPLHYLPDQDFFLGGVSSGTPTHYRMWGEDMVIEQPRSSSVITISSSSSTDTDISVSVFGLVAGYPDFEVVMTNSSNGTTSVAGSKLFSHVERVAKNNSSTGRISVTVNSGLTTVAVLPVGDTTAGIVYKKIQLWPYPDEAFPINVFYYKDPYRLVNDGDISELGASFDEAIILMATGKIKAESNQAEGDKFFLFAMDEIKSLKKTNIDKIDWFPKLEAPLYYWGGDVHPYLNARQVGSNYGRRAYF